MTVSSPFPYRTEILHDTTGERGKDVSEGGESQLRSEDALQEARRAIRCRVAQDEQGDAQERGGLQPRRQRRLHKHAAVQVRAIVGPVREKAASRLIRFRGTV